MSFTKTGRYHLLHFYSHADILIYWILNWTGIFFFTYLADNKSAYIFACHCTLWIPRVLLVFSCINWKYGDKQLTLMWQLFLSARSAWIIYIFTVIWGKGKRLLEGVSLLILFKWVTCTRTYRLLSTSSSFINLCCWDWSKLQFFIQFHCCFSKNSLNIFTL